MTRQIEFTKDGRTIKLDEVLTFLNATFFKDDLKSFPNLTEDGPYATVSAEPGSKYIRLVTTRKSGNTTTQRSAYCFLDYAGNIYMSATWKAPSTKHIRGTVFEKDYSWGLGFGRYGAGSIRR